MALEFAERLGANLLSTLLDLLELLVHGSAHLDL